MPVWKLIAVACVLCLIVLREATTPAIRGAAAVVGFGLLPWLTLKGPGTPRERWQATALVLGAIVSYAVADFGHVRAALWAVIVFGAALVVPPFIRLLALAFRTIRNAFRIRRLLRAGADYALIDDALSRM